MRCQEQAKQEAGRSDAKPAIDMKSNRALLLTLMTIIGALLVSVVSYAQTAPASTSNVITTIGISGGSGRPIPQEIPGSADLISVAFS